VKVALVLNGDEPSPDDLRLLKACEAIVAADGGARALLKSDHQPNLIVGDLDSLDPDTYKWADALDIPVERHAEAKDEIDGELALEKALALGAKSILILGGHGGRSAMFLANLKLLRRVHELGLDASMVGRGESIRYVSTGGQLTLAGRTGARLNLLAVDGDAVVDITGTQWDGNDIRIEARSGRGVSNKITADGASVRVQSGTILAIVERKRTEYHVT
jgi:thiamine pyrophosphokinase